MSGGGASPIRADFLYPRFLETANSGFLFLLYKITTMVYIYICTCKSDGQDISCIPSETEDSLVLIEKAILN